MNEYDYLLNIDFDDDQDFKKKIEMLLKLN